MMVFQLEDIDLISLSLLTNKLASLERLIKPLSMLLFLILLQNFHKVNQNKKEIKNKRRIKKRNKRKKLKNKKMMMMITKTQEKKN